MTDYKALAFIFGVILGLIFLYFSIVTTMAIVGILGVSGITWWICAITIFAALNTTAWTCTATIKN